MKKLHLLKSMLLLCALIAGSNCVWADTATITFASTDGSDGSSALTTSNFISNGIASSSSAFGTITCSETERCYKGKSGYGLKAGAASNAGSFTIAFSTPLTNVTQISLNRASYNDSKTANISVKNGSTTLANAVTTPSGSADFANMDITGLDIASLGGLTVQSSKYCYIKSITITYTPVGTDPSISLNSKTFNHTKDEVEDGSITVTYNNITSVNAEVKFFESDGTTPVASDPDWIVADINGSNNVEYMLSANLGSKRTAYLKVHEKNKNVFSSLITITQASGIDTPTFDPVGDTYTTPQNVTISSAAGGTIYYTTDGSNPTNESTVYASPVAITTSGTVLKAIVYTAQGHSEIATATYTIRPEAPTFSLASGSYVPGTSFTLTSAGNTIYYTLTTNGSNPSTPSSSSTPYTGPIVISSGTVKISAVAYDAYNNKGSVVTRTYYGVEPTTLPFSWTGTTTAGKAELDAVTGVVVNLANEDYASSNAPYRLKFDAVGKYVEIFTNSIPGVVSFTTKIFGATTTASKMKVQGSVDGVSFDDINEFTISGKANATATCTTTNPFNANHRVVRIYMSVKDQNVGVGNISISVPEPAEPTVIGETVTVPVSVKMDGWRSFIGEVDQNYTIEDGAKVYYVSETNAGTKKVTLTEIAKGIPANTPVILHKDGATSITLTKTATVIAAPSGNKLEVTTTITDLSTGVYRLGYKTSDGVGFYKYSSASAPAGIIYISALDAGANFLSFDFGDVTGIESLTPDPSPKGEGSEYYNLNGQRVAQPTKGLYIVNGKKVVIK